MLIAGDLILITEVIPKARTICMSSGRLAIPGYLCYSNFDPDSNIFTVIRGICIYVSENMKFIFDLNLRSIYGHALNSKDLIL